MRPTASTVSLIFYGRQNRGRRATVIDGLRQVDEVLLALVAVHTLGLAGALVEDGATHRLALGRGGIGEVVHTLGVSLLGTREVVGVDLLEAELEEGLAHSELLGAGVGLLEVRQVAVKGVTGLELGVVRALGIDAQHPGHDDEGNEEWLHS
eukprot:114439_1